MKSTRRRERPQGQLRVEYLPLAKLIRAPRNPMSSVQEGGVQ